MRTSSPFEIYLECFDRKPAVFVLMLNEILWFYFHGSFLWYLYGKYISSGMFLKTEVVNPTGFSGLEN